MRTTLLKLALLVAPAMFIAGGCAQYPVHAAMNDDKIAVVVSRDFNEGMSPGDVHRRLSALRVSEKDRAMYGDAPPRTLVARVHRAGGAWVDDREDASIEWVDLTFDFGPDDRLRDAWVSRGGTRYFEGWAASGRRGEPPIHWPRTPPPPVEPPRERRIDLGGETRTQS
ncbi:MAG TPA: hypothetical protein VD971_12090 [Phycisphaerales bacterium]|nr:hypothetical protein [Phycisphaerales bacterium]